MSVQPSPIAKPGRVRVFQAVKNYVPNLGKSEEIRVEAGELIYVLENNLKDYYNIKCGNKEGKVPVLYVNNSELVTSIEYPLHEAAKCGNISFLQECLEKKVSINGLDKSGSTALFWSSHAGHADVVDFLLKIPNISISSQNKLGDTPLHAAAWKNRLECVKLLVEAGADPHIKNNEFKKAVQMTSLPEAAAFLQTTMMKYKANENDYRDYSSEEEIK